ncbi:protein BCCIP homolog [Pollicipes pollicipes]|uniref:protein BCCIP homolog n=1 Tax=Pollicipes pollicipes TaxID=41117 RepID=UPI0018855679|nr:protein BCCIP homolog [Pollicipes pollicipes]
MSAKRRNVEVMDADSDSSSSESEGDPELQKYVDQNVMVDFEGRCPTQTDYHGIRQLLLPLLPRAHINWGELADTIISQNYVGSVLKQCELEGPDADDDDEEDAMDADSDKEVYGVTTVINLTERRELEAVRQLTQTLLARCKASGAPEAVQQRLAAVLGSTAEHTGLIINERFVNIPIQICMPLLTMLRDEIEAAAKKMPYNFTHYIVIAKVHRAKSKKKAKVHDAKTIWVNGEEELLDKAAECSFEFSVASETDTAVDGGWTDRDTLLTPYRRVLLLPAGALSEALEQIRRALRGSGR